MLYRECKVRCTKYKWPSACTLQGIETVRRDNCVLVRNVVTTCLEKILIGG